MVAFLGLVVLAWVYAPRPSPRWHPRNRDEAIFMNEVEGHPLVRSLLRLHRWDAGKGGASDIAVFILPTRPLTRNEAVSVLYNCHLSLLGNDSLWSEKVGVFFYHSVDSWNQALENDVREGTHKDGENANDDNRGFAIQAGEISFPKVMGDSGAIWFNGKWLEKPTPHWQQGGLVMKVVWGFRD